MTGPPAAVRSRNRSSRCRSSTLTLVLMHSWLSVRTPDRGRRTPTGSSPAHARWAPSGPPIVLSIVSRVLLVQLEKFPELKSSELIVAANAAGGAAITTIDPNSDSPTTIANARRTDMLIFRLSTFTAESGHHAHYARTRRVSNKCKGLDANDTLGSSSAAHSGLVEWPSDQADGHLVRAGRARRRHRIFSTGPICAPCARTTGPCARSSSPT